MVINDKLVQQLVDRLPDFYREYMYDINFIQELFDTYIETAGILHRHAQYICNSTSIATAEIYKPLDKKPLVLQNSLYDVLDISKQFKAATGGEWFDSNTALVDKITFLDSVGKYELLSDIDSISNAEFIIDFKICKDFSGLLGYYSPLEDYVYKDYKLYLFNQLAKPPHNATSKTILLEDIKINDHKLDYQWGMFFPGIYSVFLTRPEYRDMIASLLKFDSSIKAINEVMTTVNIPRTAVVRDKYSRKNIPTALLNKFDKDLGPFDFVFKLPPEYIGALYYAVSEFRGFDNTKLKNRRPEDLGYLYSSLGQSVDDVWIGRIINIFNFIHLIRPEHMNFFLEGTMSVFDKYVLTDNICLNGILTIADSWLEESIYGFVTYGSSPYSGSRFADTVKLASKHIIPEVYDDLLDFKVSFSVTVPTIEDQYESPADTVLLNTTAETVDSYDWVTGAQTTYGEVEYGKCTYGGEILRDATLLNLFSII